MSIYRLERDEDTDALAERLAKSTSPAVRRQAAAALGRVGNIDERALCSLVDAVQSDSDDAVRAAAIDALDSQGEEAISRLVVAISGLSVPEPVLPGTVPTAAFVDTLDAADAELRMAAVSALGRRQAPEAVPALLDRLDDEDPRVRVRAARACGEIADPNSTNALAACLDDSIVEVRQEAGEALGRIGTDAAFDALSVLLADENETVRWIAVDSLGLFEGVRPIEPLTDALADESSLVRRAAVFSLVGVLSGTPAEQSHETREAILSRLEATDDERAVRALVLIVKEGSQLPQRRNAVWLLGRLATDPDDVLDTLVACLRDDDEVLARFAATGLAELDGAVAESVLLDLLDDDTAPERARSLAVFTLGKIGGDSSRERLDALLEESDDPTIRKRTLSALSKLGGRSIG